MAIGKIAGPLHVIPTKRHGRALCLAGRAVGGADDAVTLQTANSSHGLSIAYGGATGQYVVTLPGKGGTSIMCAQVSFEGASAKTAKIETMTDSARTVRLTVQDLDLADVTLAAAEYLNFTIFVTQM